MIYGTMKVYTVEFIGHYPVGACAVVVAKDRGHARRMLMQELSEIGLAEKNESLTNDDFKLLDIRNPHCSILLDGNY